MTEYGLKRHFDSGAARLLGGLVAQVHPPFDLDGYMAEPSPHRSRYSTVHVVRQHRSDREQL